MIDKMLVMVMVLAAACGGPGGGSGDDTPVTDGHGPGPDGPAPRKHGILVIEQATIFGTSFALEGARFDDGEPTGGVERVDGPCTITTQRATQPPAVLAGSVTIDGGATAIALEPSTTSEYEGGQQGLQFAPGAQLTFAATGGPSVPAFSTALAFPGAIAVTSSPASTISKSGVSVSWTGAGRTVIVLGVGEVSIRCTFENVTTATLPASTLSDLPVGTNLDGTFIVAAATDASFTADPFTIATLLLDVGVRSMIDQVTL